MKKVILGNWKLNKTHREARDFFDEILKKDLSALSDVQLGVAPSFTSIGFAPEKDKRGQFWLGAQNVSAYLEGAYTGEVSIKQLRALDVDFVIIGHSERRALFAESFELISQKLNLALKHSLKAVLCIGETKEEYQAGQEQEVIEKQLSSAIEALEETQAKNLLIAYEPVWAIGTGLSATPDQVQKTHAFIRSLLTKKWPNLGNDLPILYGGSVKPENAYELFSEKDVNGALIGGASLKVDSFFQIAQHARRTS